MRYRLLPGLPPYGDLPITPYPAEWGRLGREGTVVEFVPSAGPTWIGNFAPGIGGASGVADHPDGLQVLVFARGAVWAVDPTAQTATELGITADAYWPVQEPEGFIIDLQGLAFLRLGAGGVAWHTRRLSWDGFAEVTLGNGTLSGNAWNAVDQVWSPFEVELMSGSSVGGAFGPGDPNGWERLALSRDAT